MNDLWELSKDVSVLGKPEWWGCHTLKKEWRYVKPFWHNTGTWRTDGRTNEIPTSLSCVSIAVLMCSLKRSTFLNQISINNNYTSNATQTTAKRCSGIHDKTVAWHTERPISFCLECWPSTSETNNSRLHSTLALSSSYWICIFNHNTIFIVSYVNSVKTTADR